MKVILAGSDPLMLFASFHRGRLFLPFWQKQDNIVVSNFFRNSNVVLPLIKQYVEDQRLG